MFENWEFLKKKNSISHQKINIYHLFIIYYLLFIIYYLLFIICNQPFGSKIFIRITYVWKKSNWKICSENPAITDSQNTELDIVKQKTLTPRDWNLILSGASLKTFKKVRYLFYFLKYLFYCWEIYFWDVFILLLRYLFYFWNIWDIYFWNIYFIFEILFFFFTSKKRETLWSNKMNQIVVCGN